MPKIGKGQKILKLLLPQLSKDMQKALATLLFDSLASHLSETYVSGPYLEGNLWHTSREVRLIVEHPDEP